MYCHLTTALAEAPRVDNCHSHNASGGNPLNFHYNILKCHHPTYGISAYGENDLHLLPSTKKIKYTKKERSETRSLFIVFYSSSFSSFCKSS